MANAYSDLLDDFFQITHDELKSLGFEQDKAHIMAVRIMDTVQQRVGGTMVYIPKKTADLIKQRNEQIIAQFNGSNHNELSHRFQLCTQQIYRILKDCNQSKQTSWLD